MGKLQNIKSKSILFVCPPFHRYHKAITEELRESGHRVTFFPDYPFVFLLKKKLPRQFRTFFSCAYDFLLRSLVKLTKPTDLFVIRGAGLDSFHIKNIKQLCPHIRVTMYQWDSLRNFDYTRLLEFCDVVSTFDPVDSAALGLRYVPLFYTKDYDITSYSYPSSFDYDLVFVGGLSEHRCSVLSELIPLLARENISFFYYLYLPFHIYFLKKVAGQLGFAKGFKVSFTSLSSREIKAIYQKTRAILDIHSLTQSGCTIRTVESFVSGRLLLTSNQSAAKLSRDSDRQLIISSFSFSSIKSNAKRIKEYEPHSLPLFSHLALNSWIKQVLGNA